MKSIILWCALFFTSTLSAQQLNMGVKLQKTHFMYWENGISAHYSFANFKPEQFYVGLDYISSRLGTAFKSNAIKQDSFIGSAAWFFQKDKNIRLVTKLNLGYFHADLGSPIFDELPNTAILLSPEFGFSYSLKQSPLIFNLGLGYNIDLQDEGQSPGTLQPLFYNFTVYYRLKGDRKP